MQNICVSDNREKLLFSGPDIIPCGRLERSIRQISVKFLIVGFITYTGASDRQGPDRQAMSPSPPLSLRKFRFT